MAETDKPEQSGQQVRQGEGRSGVADIVLRQDLRDGLERVENKLDRLEEKIEQAVEKRVSKDEYAATMDALEKRIARLENAPQRLNNYFGTWVALAALLISLFWVALYLIQHP